MQQVKLFTGLEGATEELAEEINSWIRKTGAKILQISGNIAPQTIASFDQTVGLPAAGSTALRPPSDLFIIILYATE